jgi:hypothetical protein
MNYFEEIGEGPYRTSVIGFSIRPIARQLSRKQIQHDRQVLRCHTREIEHAQRWAKQYFPNQQLNSVTIVSSGSRYDSDYENPPYTTYGLIFNAPPVVNLECWCDRPCRLPQAR